MSKQSVHYLIASAIDCCELNRYNEAIGLLKKFADFCEPCIYKEKIIIRKIFLEKLENPLETWKSFENYSKDSIVVKTLKPKVKKEIDASCDNLIHLLDNKFIKNAKTADDFVFYKCLKAIQYKYKLYVKSVKKKNCFKGKARKLYEEALSIAKDSLKPSHPSRIWIGLEFCSFYVFVLNNVDKGLETAEKTYNEACSNLSELDIDLHSYTLSSLSRLREYIEEIS